MSISSHGPALTPVGKRNDTLFKHCLRVAPKCSSEADLLTEANTFNTNRNMVPLSTQEVEKVVKSAWYLEKSDNNWVGHGSKAVLQDAAVEDILAADNLRGGDAVALWARLQHWHGARNGTFAISPHAMARNQKIPGWTAHRYRRTRDILLKCSLIKCVSQGGRKVGDPYQYQFT